MKQTNNAIKFLMAQYRSVFQHAFLKGLAATVVLTAGLSAFSAQAASDTNAPLNLTEGTYTADKDTPKVIKDNQELTETETKLGKITADSNGTLAIKGQVVLNNATFVVPSDEDGANYGARVSFDNVGTASGGFEPVSGGYFNDITLIGTNRFNDQLTVHSKTILRDGGSGRMDVQGCLTISAQAKDSDLSAVNIFIKPDSDGYADLTIDPDITVGNLTFESGSTSTDIDVYADKNNDGANYGSKTINVINGKAVTFADGEHNIKTSLTKTQEESQLLDGNDPSSKNPQPALVFAGSNQAKVVNYGNLNVKRPVTFSGGIVFNNNKNVSVFSGSADGKLDNNGNLIFNSSTLSNNAGATLTMGSGTTLTLDETSTFINEGKITLKSDADAVIDVATLAVSRTVEDEADEITYKIIDLESALGNFNNSGTLTLTHQSEFIEYGLDTDINNLNELGVDFSSTDGTANIIIDHVALRVNDSFDLSSDSIKANISGSGLYGKAELQSLETLTYTTAASGTEDLNGLELVGIESLQFASGKKDGSDASSILVSGSNAGSTQFGVNQSLTSKDNKDLKFQNVFLTLDDYTLNCDTLISGTVDVNLIMDSGSELLIGNNAWTAQNITVQSGGTFTLDTSLKDVGLTANKITLSGSASAITVSGGYLTAKTFDVASDASKGFNVSNKAVITVKGDNDTDTVDLKGGTNISLSNSTLNLGNVADTVGMTFANGKLNVSNGYKGISGENVEINVNLDNVKDLTSLTIDQANGILSLLTQSGSGLVHITGTKQPEIKPTTNEITGEQEVTFGSLTSGSTNGSLNLTFDTEITQNSVLTGVDKDVTGGWKAVQTTGSDASVAANGTLSLQGAKTGNYAQDASGSVVGVNLKSNANLNLKATAENSGKGYIGEISGNGTTTLTVATNADVSVIDKTKASANVKVGTLESNGTLTARNVTTETLTNAGKLTAAEVTVTKATFDQNSVLNAETLNIKDTGSASGAELNVDKLNISGSTTLTGSSLNSNSVNAVDLTLSENTVANVSGTISTDSLTLTGDSKLTATTLTLNGDSKELRVGQDSGENTTGSSAQLSVTSLVLNGGKLIIDPELNDKTATVFAQNFEAARKDDTSVTTLNGTIIVGKNSALGLGGTEEAFNNALARYQTNGSLSNEYGAYVYINRANLNLGTGKLVIGSEAVSDLEGYATGTAAIYLGKDSALQVSQKAINEANKNSSYVFTDMDVKTIQSTDGTLIIPANLSAKNIATIFGNTVVLNTGDNIKVTTENGLYTGIINNSQDLQGTGDFSLTLADDSRKILSGLSNPTYDYVINVMSQDSAHYDNAKAFEDALAKDQETNPAYGKNDVAIIDESEGYQFLQEALGSSHYQAIEQGSRLALFGGAVQAAQVASNSTTDAVNSRLGMGNSASRLTVADNAQGAGLWVAPVYRNFSSDSFDGQGLGYGADVDLTGAALGADFTMSNGLRLGLAFNVGSGDADGQGAGAGVSNDFDYFGLALYAGFSPIQNLTLSADVSYTNIDNDVEANSGVSSYGKFTASTDSTAWSVGVGAQYLMQTASLDVAPHIGLRYTNFDVDDYDLKIDGTTIAHTNGDSASVFSIPVGVSLSKDLSAGEWTVRPAADFTVTFNMGDDDIDSSTTFDGVFGDEIKYNTEFSDNVTYGANFGVSAKNGNLSFGLNAGYTGSSNTDEYTVGANARFVF